MLANDVDPDASSGLRSTSAELVEPDPGSVTSSRRRRHDAAAARLRRHDGRRVHDHRRRRADGHGGRAPHRRPAARTGRRSPPTTAPRSAEGDSVTVDVLRNDRDPDNDPLTLTVARRRWPLGEARIVRAGLDHVPCRARVDRHRPRSSTGSATASSPSMPRCSSTCGHARRPSRRRRTSSLFTGYEQPLAIDLTAYARNGTVVEVGPPLGVPAGTYVPPPGENGNVSFDYVVAGGCERRDTGRVTHRRQPRSRRPGRSRSTCGPARCARCRSASWRRTTSRLTITALQGAPPWASISGGGVELRPPRSQACVVLGHRHRSRRPLGAGVGDGPRRQRRAGGERRPGRRERRGGRRSTCWRTTATPTATRSASSRCRRRRRSTVVGRSPSPAMATGPCASRPAAGAAGTATFTYTIVDAGGRESNAGDGDRGRPAEPTAGGRERIGHGRREGVRAGGVAGIRSRR